MIERVFVLNLPRRLDKKYAMLGSLLTRGVPIDMIEFFPGVDAAEYPDAFAARCAAIADGFKEFEEMNDEWIQHAAENRDDSPARLGGLCCLWAYKRMIRHIQGTSYNCVLATLDDFILPLHFRELTRLVGLLSDMKVFQVSSFVTSFNADDPHSTVYKAPDFPCFHLADRRIHIGACGTGDQCFVLTREGAQQLLDYCKKFPTLYIENIMGKIGQDYHNKPVGFYALNMLAYPDTMTDWGSFDISRFSELPHSERMQY